MQFSCPTRSIESIIVVGSIDQSGPEGEAGALTGATVPAPAANGASARRTSSTSARDNSGSWKNPSVLFGTLCSKSEVSSAGVSLKRVLNRFTKSDGPLTEVVSTDESEGRLKRKSAAANSGTFFCPI